MNWSIKFSKKASKDFLKLSFSTKKQIEKFLLKLVRSENPRSYGEALKGDLNLFWRYRVGDYRLISQINDEEITVFVLAVGHRKEIYSK